MTSDKMISALNEQINKELFSAYLYLSMAAWFEDQALPGFASWMKVQAQEEVSHAIKIFNYIVDRDGRALLAPLAGPETAWDSPLAAFEAALKHERFISTSINELVSLAMEQRDFATQQFLQWYVEEQVEEEATAKKIIDQVKLVGKDGLYLLDKELGSRGFAYPGPALSGGEAT